MDHLAVDIGASSGRVMRGSLKDGRLMLDEVHRFTNGMVYVDGHHRWNIERIIGEVCKGLKKAAKKKVKPASIGVDTWGVDFVLLDGQGELLEEPVAYRDPRTDGMMTEFFKRMPQADIYRRTAIQFMQINTLYQLFSIARKRPEVMKKAKRILMIPDYINYRLTGEMCMEFTSATTTQMLSAAKKEWDADILDRIGLDPGLFSKPVPPGTVIGELVPELRKRTGLGRIPVIAPATHDTGSAVASVPASGKDWAYISSGTWSLMGVELDHPVNTNAALEHNFTSEGGVFGTYRYLKNLTGLWLLQGLKSSLPGHLTYPKLTAMAKRAKPFGVMIEPGDPAFMNPRSMKDAFDAFFKLTGQTAPRTAGGYARCALEGLALAYKGTLDELRATQPNKITKVHIIGGGCKNRLLDQMTADALGIPVFAGPVEGTAIGNIMLQAIALGGVKDLKDSRAVVRDSFNIEKYMPKDTKQWNGAWKRFKER